MINSTGTIYGGTFTGGIVQEGEVIATEAMVENTYYSTIEDALNMTKSGDNITLIRSAILDFNATINAGVTLTISSEKVLTIGKDTILTNNGNVLFEKEAEIENNGTFICNNHIGGTATCTKKAVCELCRKTYGEFVAHTGGKATCVKKAVCEVCNQPYGEVDSFNGHKKEFIAGKASTCTEKGLTDGKKCSVCGETLIAQEEIPALGHTEETMKGYAATCTENGLTNGLR